MTKGSFKRFGAAVLASMTLMTGIVGNAAEPVDIPPVSEQPAAEGFEVVSNQNLPSEAGAAVYAQAMLDAYIRLDPTVAVEQGYISSQQWAENYKTQFENLKKELPYMPDEALNKFLDAAMNIVSKTNYMAGATRQLEDGSFEVTILYEQMIIDEDEMVDRFLENMMEWEASLPMELSDIAEEDIILGLATIMTNVLNLYCEFPVYAEPATTTIIVTYKDGNYQIANSSYDEIASLVFAFI